MGSPPTIALITETPFETANIGPIIRHYLGNSAKHETQEIAYGLSIGTEIGDLERP